MFTNVANRREKKPGDESPALANESQENISKDETMDSTLNKTEIEDEGQKID